ncbi:MAG: GH36 C-terminal domain-containing protein, partial [Bacteroidaceae bacterium]|nr:GH36 C-terminal domain-containing protein [Bacteroidaceae bacterium]
GRTDHWEGRTFTGKFLMNQGVEIAFGGQFSSKVIRLVKQ